MRGIHDAVVDLFTPTPRDPDGVDAAIWDRLGGRPFDPRPAGTVLTAVSFDAGDTLTAYSDPRGVGDPFPDVPLFLTPGRYVNPPFESTYAASWAVLQQVIRDGVAPPG